MVFTGRTTINITAKDAKQPFKLLIFTKPISTTTSTSSTFELYQDYFPVAWRVIAFGDSACEYSTDFTLSLSAFVGKTSENQVVRVLNSSKDISEGQSVSVVLSGVGGAPIFKEPTTRGGSDITIENNTGDCQCLGLKIDGKPAVVFNNVENGQKAIVRFEPRIYLAVNQDYMENEIIRDEIKHVVEIDLNATKKSSVNIAVHVKGSDCKITYD